MNIDEAIALLEEKAKAYTGEVPGTSIGRVLLDKVYCDKWDVPYNPKTGCGRAWCLSLGGMSAPKVFIYGVTIEQTFKKALEAFEVIRDETMAVWAELGRILSKEAQ